MSYQVTARKWRPLVFEDVVGQEHITATLRNAIAANRVAHAYLFSGQRGCGKTTTARILAKALNCSSPVDSNPDNRCEACIEINNGSSLDVIEIDGASNRGVDEIRNLRDSVRFAPARGKYKIYIIDEVHMLTKEAFNALLKTLEEPPPHVVFIFATTEIFKLPMTILSRCQRFDFRRIAMSEIIGRLKYIASEEHITIDDDALVIIAKKGDGSMRDAQSIFDQVRAFCGDTISTEQVIKVLNVVDEEILFRVTDLIKAKNAAGGITLVDEVVKGGHDLKEFVSGLVEHLRNLLILNTSGSLDLIETSDTFKKRYDEEAKKFSEDDLLRLLKIAHDLEQTLRWAPQPRYKVEAALLMMIKMESSVRLDDLIRQVEELKTGSIGTKQNPQGYSQALDTKSSAADSSQMTNIRVIGAINANNSLSSKGTTTGGVKTIAPFAAGFRGIAEPKSVQSLIPKTNNGEPINAELFWGNFVEEVHKTKINLGSILRGSRLREVRDGALRLTVPDDYHLHSILRNKEYLSTVWKNVSGINARFEPQIQSEAAQLHDDAEDTAAKEPIEPATNEEQKRLLDLLRSELGAEPVR